MSDQKITYCAELVREQDPDRFLLSMVMPPKARQALWALFAFNHEIAKTREIVSETQLGLIRLQWWRDALEGIYARDEVLEHEVLQALALAIKEYALPQQLFEDVLYAREFDLEDRLPATLEGLVKYAEFTTVPLNKLVLMVLGEDIDEAALRDVSVAYAMTGLLRAIPYHCGQRRCYLPEDMVQGAGIRMDHLYEYKAMEQLVPLVTDIAAHIEKQAATKPPKGYLRASRVLTKIYLKQLKRAEYNVFDATMAQPPAFFHLRFFLGIVL